MEAFAAALASLCGALYLLVAVAFFILLFHRVMDTGFDNIEKVPKQAFMWVFLLFAIAAMFHWW